MENVKNKKGSRKNARTYNKTGLDFTDPKDSIADAKSILIPILDFKKYKTLQRIMGKGAGTSFGYNCLHNYSFNALLWLFPFFVKLLWAFMQMNFSWSWRCWMELYSNFKARIILIGTNISVQWEYIKITNNVTVYFYCRLSEDCILYDYFLKDFSILFTIFVTSVEQWSAL